MQSQEMRTAPRVPTTHVLAVVPVLADDPQAPLGCSALRQLAGHTQVERAVRALLRSGACDAIVVVVPGAVRVVIETEIGPRAGVEVVTASGAHPAARLQTAIAGRDAEILIVHDPAYPLVPAATVSAVLAALLADPSAAAAVAARPVTDTLKWVDAGDVVQATADRETFRTVLSPCALRVDSLRTTWFGVQSELDPLRALAGAGMVIRTVAAVGEAFKIHGPDDVALAEAMIREGIDLDELTSR